MKIDFYISSLSGGGAEHVLTNIARNAAEQGHDVSITTFEKRPQFYEVDPKIKINRCNNTGSGRLREVLRDYRDMRRQLKKRKADVVISFLSRTNMMLALAAPFTKSKIIVCDRNNRRMSQSAFVFNLSCQLYRMADMVGVQTNRAKASYPKYLTDKIFVIANPLDREQLDSQCPENEPERTKTVISVGRLEQAKDFETLITAFAKTAQEYPDWKLNIYGQGEKHDLLQNMIEQLGQEHRITLCGVTKTVFSEMKKSGIFVLSSRYEGFPNVLCEAMYAGLPCISSDCEFGPSELISDSENGYLFPVGDADRLYQCLTALMADPSKRARMGELAKNSTDFIESSRIYEEWNTLIQRAGKRN